jgi:hypothetical protein
MAKVFHFRSLMPDQGCRISQGAVKCKDGAMVEWQWAGRKDNNSEKFCSDVILPLPRTHEVTRNWTESSVVRNPCFKRTAWEMFQGNIAPPKRRTEELNDRLIRLICYKVSRMLAFQTVFCTFSCYNINTLHNQFFMTLWELPTVQIKNVSSRNIHEGLPTAILTQL